MTEPTQRDKFCALLVDRRIDRTLGVWPGTQKVVLHLMHGKMRKFLASTHLTKQARNLRLQMRIATPQYD